jgi:hypothetical protein
VILVPQKYFGTAYGIMEALINVGNVAMYYGIATLLQNKNYFLSLFIFMLLSVVGFMFSIFWLLVDLKTGSWCNLPSKVQVQLHKDEIPEGMELRHDNVNPSENEKEPLLIN